MHSYFLQTYNFLIYQKCVSSMSICHNCFMLRILPRPHNIIVTNKYPSLLKQSLKELKIISLQGLKQFIPISSTCYKLQGLSFRENSR